MRPNTYQQEIQRLYQFLVPTQSRVLDLNCGTGTLLAALQPTYGLGLDRAADVIDRAREIACLINHPLPHLALIYMISNFPP